jgi:hypothetical protein
MIASRGERDLQTLIDATSVRPPGNAPIHVDPLPRNFAEVAEAVGRHRERFEAGGVFPPELLEAVTARLRTARPPRATTNPASPRAHSKPS